MEKRNEKIPSPQEIEKEISEFLSKKFKNNVKVISPVVLPQELTLDNGKESPQKVKKISFDLLPEDLISYLDQYIVKQDMAKAVLATKICTHFNRIRRAEDSPDDFNEMVGSIKNNVLMIGPTGVVDWLERRVWDAYTDCESDQGDQGEIEDACNCLNEVKQEHYGIPIDADLVSGQRSCAS